uniref:Putative GDP-mannose 4,6-dehydratase n=1 Tax=viral metagenome TaxID=1070528 RepID=A0A6H1ZKU8_9ZZZZ
MKNIIITGGCGFLGSNFIKIFKVKNPEWHIINIDALTYAGNLGNLKEIENSSNYTFIHMNIKDDSIADVFKDFKPDIVLSMASETHVDRSIKDPRAFLESDILGVFNLAYNSLKYGVKKFFHISTDEVYGSLKHPTEASEYFNLNPTSPYAASKAAADLLLLSYYKTYKLPLTIIRPCNNYGNSQFAEKLIPTTIARFLTGKRAIMHGTGKEIREWITVHGCCNAILGIIKKGRVGEIYNVGSGIRLTNMMVVREIIHEIFGMFGKPTDFIEFVMNRPGNDSRYAINSSKTEKLIGKYELITFKEGIRATVDWYRKNKWFWCETNLDSNLYSEEYLR